MNTLYIVIPAYNEEANIETVVKEWYEVIKERSEESRLVVIDDGSKDSTYAIMQKLAETMPKFVPLTKPNGGHGATVLYGYRYALEHGADYVFQTDSDGQTRPEEFPQFWEKREQYHMVIGHRKGRQDGLSRVFVTKTLKLVCLLCFHVRVKDANTPFRIMQAE
ncbi:MAG: glycosyltransferase family 2 protein, partial [Lachnospiraceae bacterium]|nr:glycosyltransferase family 2 protein [Lachnospiraceae bacterium]